jgi:hypothetical protein
MPTQEPYTFAIHTYQQLDQKLQKSMSFAYALKEMKLVANLKENNMKMKEVSA